MEKLVGLPSLDPSVLQTRMLAAKQKRLEQLASWDNHDNGAELNPTRTRRITIDPTVALLDAAACNDVAEVEQLLKLGASPNLQNSDGLSALHQASIEDNVDVLQVLLDHGADVNITDADLWTPLHAAVASCSISALQCLLNHGADITATNTDGELAIDLIDSNFPELEQIIDRHINNLGLTPDNFNEARSERAQRLLSIVEGHVQNQADLNMSFDQGGTLLHIACANGYKDVTQYLLDHGAKVDSKDKDGWQPVHAAACWGHLGLVEILYHFGADLDAETNLHETPSDLVEDEDFKGFIHDLKNVHRKPQGLQRSNTNQFRAYQVRRSSLKDKSRLSKDDIRLESTELKMASTDEDSKGDGTIVFDTAPTITKAYPVGMSNGITTSNSSTSKKLATSQLTKKIGNASIPKRSSGDVRYTAKPDEDSEKVPTDDEQKAMTLRKTKRSCCSLV